MEPATAFDRSDAAPLLPDRVRPLVRRPRLGAAPAPARIAGEGAGRAFGAADRADRRRQDAGRLPADAGGAARGAAAPRRLVSTGRDVRRSQGLHTLYISPLKALAVDIARNLEIPVREMGLAGAAGNPHRRHAGLQTPAPAPLSARHPAHHAGATGAAAGVGRRALSVRHAPPRGARRIAFAGDVQARRSAVARSGAAVRAGAAAHHRRPLGHRGRARRSRPLSGAAAAGGDGARRSGRGASRRAAVGHHARHRRALALGRPFGAPRARRNLRS